MCGIVGLITACSNGLHYNEAEAFRDMLVVDSLRGFDSTGVMSVSNLGNLLMMKDAINGASFVKHNDYKEFHSNIVRDGMFVFGHNRAATRGIVNDKNAHPFVIDDKICLMQNGTMRGDHKKHKDVEVDTEAVAHVIAEEDDVEKALQKIDAAYAFVWYNTKTKKLHIIRNNERPLYIAYTDVGSIMFASEAPTILLSAARNSVKLRKAPYLIRENELITYTIDNDKKDWEVEYNDKIDTKYKGGPNHYDWQSQFCNVGRIAQHYLFGQEEDDHTDEVKYPQLPAPSVSNVHNFRNTGMENKFMLTTTIRDMIARGVCDNWLVDSAEAANAYQAHYQPLALSGAKRIIEWSDYKPANDMRDCRVWYLFGHLTEPNGVSPKVLVYTIKYNTEEDTIVKQVIDDPIVLGELNIYHNHVCQNNLLETRWIPTINVSNIQQVPTVTQEANVINMQ